MLNGSPIEEFRQAKIFRDSGRVGTVAQSRSPWADTFPVLVGFNKVRSECDRGAWGHP